MVEGRDNRRENYNPRRKDLSVSQKTFASAYDIHTMSPTEVTHVSNMSILTAGQYSWSAGREALHIEAQSAADDTDVPRAIERNRLVGDVTTPLDRVYLFDGKIRLEDIDAQRATLEFDINATVHDPDKNQQKFDEGLDGVYDDFEYRVDTGLDLLSDQEVLSYLKELKGSLGRKHWPSRFVLPKILGDKGAPAEETVELFSDVTDALAKQTGDKHLRSSWSDDGTVFDLRSLVQRNGEIVQVGLIGMRDQDTEEGIVERAVDSWKYYKIGEPQYTSDYAECAVAVDAEEPQLDPPVPFERMLAEKKFDFDLALPVEPKASKEQAQLGLDILRKRQRQLTALQRPVDDQLPDTPSDRLSSQWWNDPGK